MSISTSKSKNCWSCRTIFVVISIAVVVILVAIYLVAIGANYVRQKLVLEVEVEVGAIFLGKKFVAEVGVWLEAILVGAILVIWLWVVFGAI